MSHDRGCACGREKYDYEDCPHSGCNKKAKLKMDIKFFATDRPGVLARSVNGLTDYGSFNAEGEFIVLKPPAERYRFTIHTHKTTYSVERTSEELINPERFIEDTCKTGIWISEYTFVSPSGIACISWNNITER